MSDTEALRQLAEMLSSPLIKKRRTGIKLAAALLAQDTQVDAVRKALDIVAQDDSMNTLRDAARAALEYDLQRRTVPLPDYMIGARCSACSAGTQLDKRDVCAQQGTLLREPHAQAQDQREKVLVKCHHCGQEFKITISCKGYR